VILESAISDWPSLSPYGTALTTSALTIVVWSPHAHATQRCTAPHKSITGVPVLPTCPTTRPAITRHPPPTRAALLRPAGSSRASLLPASPLRPDALTEYRPLRAGGNPVPANQINQTRRFSVV